MHVLVCVCMCVWFGRPAIYKISKKCTFYFVKSACAVRYNVHCAHLYVHMYTVMCIPSMYQRIHVARSVSRAQITLPCSPASQQGKSSVIRRLVVIQAFIETVHRPAKLPEHRSNTASTTSHWKFQQFGWDCIVGGDYN